jgi:hypothetical protein
LDGSLERELAEAQQRVDAAVERLPTEADAGVELDAALAEQWAAERTLAAARGEEHAVPFELGVRWSGGAPLSHLLSSGMRSFVAFYLDEPDPDRDGTRNRDIVANNAGDQGSELIEAHPEYALPLYTSCRITRVDEGSARLRALELVETHCDQSFHDHLWQWLVDRKVQRALGHRVTRELVGQLRQNRTAERQVAQMMSERREAGDRRTADTEGRNTVGDHLLGIGDDLENRPAERRQRRALGLFDGAQVLVDLLG